MILFSQAVALLSKTLDYFRNPPKWFEPLVWSVVVASVILPRALMFSVAPSALWSGDAESFITPAMSLMSGEKEVSSKRGLGYILMLIPFIASPQSFFPALGVFQQALMGGVIVGAAVFVRLLLGRATLLFILIFGIGASLYDVPIFVAHLIRNETLQAFCLMLGMGFLGLALKKNSDVVAVFSGMLLAFFNLVKATQPLLILFAAPALWWRHRAVPDCWMPTVTLLYGYTAVFFLPSLLLSLAGVNFKTESYAGRELYSQVAHIGLLDSKKYPALSAAIREEVEKYISLNKRDNGYVRDNIISEIASFTAEHPGIYPPVDTICRTLAFEILATYPLKCAADFWKKAVIFHTRTGFKTDRPRLSHIREADADARTDHEELMMQDALAEKFALNFEPALALGNAQETKQYLLLKRLTRWAFPNEFISIVMLTTLLSLAMPFFTSGWLRLWCLQMTFVWLFFVVLHVTVGEPKDRFLVPMMSISLWLCLIGAYQLAKTFCARALAHRANFRFAVQK